MPDRTACQRRLEARLNAIEDAGLKTPTMAGYLTVPTYQRVKYILGVVTRRYRIDPARVLGSRGSHRVSIARQEAMYLASLLTQHRTVDLGPLFNRHYSSFSYDSHTFARRWGLSYDKLDPVEGITAALVLEYGGRETVRRFPHLVVGGDDVEHPARTRPDPCRHPGLGGGALDLVRPALPGRRPGGDAPLEIRAEG